MSDWSEMGCRRQQIVYQAATNQGPFLSYDKG
jgi:hypothetical protein